MPSSGAVTGGFVAVDLGASSGRVMLGEVGPDRLRLAQVRRFANVPVRVPHGVAGASTLHWDVFGLWHEIIEGLREVARIDAAPASIGIDSWAVDYALLDARGRLVGAPHHYRDARTAPAVAVVHGRVPFAELYRLNGLQHLPITTIYQVAAECWTEGAASTARRLLLVPDLLSHWLGAPEGAEITNASTTGLLDVRTGEWSPRLAAAAGIDPMLLPPLRRPGDVIGTLRPWLAQDVGLPATTAITAVGSHDTASAVVGVPAQGERFAYIACGTWALVGVELDAPVLTEAGRDANFTNEGGVDGRVRYLRNVMGLWLLQECLRVWARADGATDPAAALEGLLAAADALPVGGPVIDVDQAAFLPPGDMPARVLEACRRAGLPEPRTRAHVVRCILDSLADAFARTVAQASELSGRQVDVVHLVGGGARNDLLCRLTARACGLPVLAGPVEASAVGNVLVQARSHGAIHGDLDALRALVGRTHEIRRYEPARA